jgi:hypothetical protein
MDDGLNTDLLSTASRGNVPILGNNLDLLASLDQSLENRYLRGDHLRCLLAVDLYDDFCRKAFSVLNFSMSQIKPVRTHSRASLPAFFR